MRLRLLNILLANVTVFGIAALVSASCTVNLPVTAFRCSPSSDEPCPTSDDDNYICCSDDPAALRLSTPNELVTPKYQSRGGEGTPLFSGGNNPLSRSGMCVREGSVPISGALTDTNAQGCPVPCNPTWSKADIGAVCGANTLCCQTVEIEPEDCVLDPTVGDNNGCYRPATGYDINDQGGLELTNWSGATHRTHQDPNGTNCAVFVAGLETAGVLTSDFDKADALTACYNRLTVANQRGFCLGGAGVVACPLAQASYRDACEQRNDAEGREGCDEVEFP